MYTYIHVCVYTYKYWDRMVCLRVCICIRIYVYIHIYIVYWKSSTLYCKSFTLCPVHYGAATNGRLHKIIALFCKYRLFYRALLQKRPMILRSLLLEATPESHVVDTGHLGSPHDTLFIYTGYKTYCTQHTLCVLLYFWKVSIVTFIVTILLCICTYCIIRMGREVGGWGRDPFSRKIMSPTPRRKWYLTTACRFH